MNILDFHKTLIQNYRRYINSFLNIKDETIKNFVDKAIEDKKLWPEPLIQFNPTYEPGRPLSLLVKEGKLHAKLDLIFNTYTLHRHQEEAILLGAANKEFVVTSGTGSGKSLTFIATIFNHILKTGNSIDNKTVAVIVYPMNALINSQFEEIKKYKERYEKKHGTFGISFARYTGQEDEDEREIIRQNPPHILLTNYMMLEHLMTRGGDGDILIRKNILDNIRYLVFDELHTYRGRQGSDVSMLIRRIKSMAENPVISVGTSATMVSGDNTSIADQRKQVAAIASKIFGSIIGPDQVVNEYLIRSIGKGHTPDTAELQAAISLPIDFYADADRFENHPLANWLEEEIALARKEGQWIRRKPITLPAIGEELAKRTGIVPETCELQLINLLGWANQLNTAPGKKKNYLPYRIHQFIAQTGSVYATLGDQQNREFRLEAGLYADNADTFLFPLLFSRDSGHEFYAVIITKEKLIPLEFYNTADEEDEESDVEGYIFVQHREDNELLWDDNRDISELPESWFNPKRKDGSRTLKKEHKQRLPRTIFFDKDGSYSFTDKKTFQGWFIPKPLKIDPTSGTIRTERTDWIKLARLGGEGRSTATTVLSFETIMLLHQFRLESSTQKLLSFTDNRQDASLQAGHFNDFIKNGQLRAAIVAALEKNKQLDYTTIAGEVFAALAIDQSQFARKASSFPGPKKDNEDAFREFILYKLLHDLRRSWRVVLPNLEQCALLRISYKHLQESANDETLWKGQVLLQPMTPDERIDFLTQVFDYFRKSYALSHSLLEPGVMNTKAMLFREKLKNPWTLDDSERLEYPNHIRIEKLAGRFANADTYSESAGYLSIFGRYIKKIAGQYNIDLKSKDRFTTSIRELFHFLEDAGWLSSKKVKAETGDPTSVFQLRVDTICWIYGDSKTLRTDKIRTRYFRPGTEPKPNSYFQKFYSINFREVKPIEGREHTGQIKALKRKEREEQFRNGDISALFCSPTMELGIDISDLVIVHMRNVPPSPANYAQRSGRAGRSGQAALVLVYCSNFNPHDRNYFKQPEKMVAGEVNAPRIDLINEELLSSHLHASILTRRSIAKLKKSLGELVDKDDLQVLPLREEVTEALKLSEEDKLEILRNFKKTVSDTFFTNELKERKPNWYSDDWIRRQIDEYPETFNKAMSRWRNLYRVAILQFRAANEVIENRIYAENHDKIREAKNARYQAERQQQLLLNEPDDRNRNNTKSEESQQSEFYPYRYLAAEGFLPGYGFTRLPVRAYLANREDGGEYLSRPRNIALAEFGPRNIIYHDGAKYRVDRIILTEAEAKMDKAKISPHSGYIMMKDQFNFNMDPILNLPLIEGMDDHIHPDLVEMPEARAFEMQRINCQEEERTRKGYDIRTYFSVENGFENMTEAQVQLSGQQLLHIHAIPAARLVHINYSWKGAKEKGYALHLKNGYWQTKEQEADESRKDDIRKIKLFTTGTANAIYLQPVEALGLQGGADGVVTLMFALKRAIENHFQVETNEIGATIMGKEENPNILIFEASEGSLGVLTQLVENPDTYRAVMGEAWRICFQDKTGNDIPENELVPASYENLLSYYNQYFHTRIDVRHIRHALQTLRESGIEVQSGRAFKSYAEQFEFLETNRDQESDTEKQFLAYLKKNHLRLPDEAQPTVNNMFVRPDFFYRPNIYIFCDGTPHDDPEIQADDTAKRAALKSMGFQVLSWHYRESLDVFVTNRPDIFKKVK